jgi:hypothetical protein
MDRSGSEIILSIIKKLLGVFVLSIVGLLICRWLYAWWLLPVVPGLILLVLIVTRVRVSRLARDKPQAPVARPLSENLRDLPYKPPGERDVLDLDVPE